MRTMRLILNGKSAFEPGIREAVEAIRDRGHLLEVRITWEPGHAAHFATEAAAAGTDVVIAGGGDGTINEVVRGLLSPDLHPPTPDSRPPTPDPRPPTPALAVLPLGTANDFARGLGIPQGDPLAALVAAAESPLSPFDVGLVNGRPFINVASGGFAAEITARTPLPMKKALGGVAYSIAGLFAAPDLKPYPCQLMLAGQTIDLDIATLAIGNCRLAGGGFEVAPVACSSDGLLDLVIVPAVPLADLPQLVRELFQPADAENQHILYWQLPEFELRFADDFQLNLDGEPLHARHFHCTLAKQQLSVAAAGGVER
jgi:lipid kinase YegS